MDKAKSKFGRKAGDGETLPGDEIDCEKQKAKEIQKQQRKAERREQWIGPEFAMPGRGGQI